MWSESELKCVFCEGLTSAISLYFPSMDVRRSMGCFRAPEVPGNECWEVRRWRAPRSSTVESEREWNVAIRKTSSLLRLRTHIQIWNPTAMAWNWVETIVSCGDMMGLSCQPYNTFSYVNKYTCMVSAETKIKISEALINHQVLFCFA